MLLVRGAREKVTVEFKVPAEVMTEWSKHFLLDLNVCRDSLAQVAQVANASEVEAPTN